MVSAKDIIVKPITAQAANALVKRVHYSGKIVNNSTLHLGAYLNDKLEGLCHLAVLWTNEKYCHLLKRQVGMVC